MPRRIIVRIKRNRRKQAQDVVDEINRDREMGNKVAQTVSERNPALARQRRLVR